MSGQNPYYGKWCECSGGWPNYGQGSIPYKPETRAYVPNTARPLYGLREKVRGQVGRDEWMASTFGEDWRTNGRVAPRKDRRE